MAERHTCVLYIDNLHLYTVYCSLLCELAKLPKVKAFLCFPAEVLTIAKVLPTNNVTILSCYEYTRKYTPTTVEHIRHTICSTIEQIQDEGYDSLLFAGDALELLKAISLESLQRIEEMLDEIIEDLDVTVRCYYPMHSSNLKETGISTHNHFNDRRLLLP